MQRGPYIVCLEGGGSRCQAVLLDTAASILAKSQSSDVNTNFVSVRAAQSAAPLL